MAAGLEEQAIEIFNREKSENVLEEHCNVELINAIFLKTLSKGMYALSIKMISEFKGEIMERESTQSTAIDYLNSRFKEEPTMMEPKIYLIHQFIPHMKYKQFNLFMGILGNLINSIGELVTQNLNPLRVSI